MNFSKACHLGLIDSRSSLLSKGVVGKTERYEEPHILISQDTLGMMYNTDAVVETSPFAVDHHMTTVLPHW